VRVFLACSSVLRLMAECTAHPHTSLNLPAVSSISLDPILFTQVPALDTVQQRLLSFVDASTLTDKSQTRTSLTNFIFPWLKTRFAVTPKGAAVAPAPPAVAQAFSQAAASLISTLPVASLFPLLDIWRLALLDAGIAGSTLTQLVALLTKISEAEPPRPTLLTLLRLLANALAVPSVARALLKTDARGALTRVLVQTLLHTDRLVRVAAASTAFNAAAWVQRGRVALVRGERGDASGETEEDGDWAVEVVSAVVEAVGTEEESEDVGTCCVVLPCAARGADGWRVQCTG